MTREQLEHVIRAAAEITGDAEIVVIGSTSILGQYPSAPLELLGSIEADVYPRNHPERFEMLDVIGEMSRFQDTFGYYADPVQHDLPRLNRAAIRHGLVQRDVLLARLGAMDVDPALRQVLRGQIEADFAR